MAEQRIDVLREMVAESEAEMTRYLPILETLEHEADWWGFCSQGTG